MLSKQTDINFYLKWCACAVTLAGALCTSLRIDPLNIYLLNLGAVLYLCWGYRIREWNLVAINTGLLIIYLYGLYLSQFRLPNHKYSMETFVMLIMLLHLDPDGYPYTSTMVQDPQTEYSTLASCERAANIKRTDMLKSSVKYPDLGIIDVKITCVPTELMGTNPDNPEI